VKSLQQGEHLNGAMLVHVRQRDKLFHHQSA
jgi:hypothetical protein